MDGMVRGTSSTSGDGSLATSGALLNTFFLRLPFGVAVTSTPWPNGFRTGFLGSVMVE